MELSYLTSLEIDSFETKNELIISALVIGLELPKKPLSLWSNVLPEMFSFSTLNKYITTFIN